MTDASRLERLERAFAAYLELDDAATPEERASFLSAHDEIRDLLEPMLGADRDAGARLEPGDDTLGDFRLAEEIGRGGMGVVHAAWQISLRRRVAVKILPASLMTHPRAIARFRREAEIMAVLDHPGLVKVFGVGQEGDRLYYAMELIDGAPLSERAAGDNRLEPRAAAHLIAQVAEALDHAHRLGIVHRDVKPANVLIRADGSPVLTDFGLARHDALPSMTMTGDFAGTPYYAAPEQAAGGPVDARTDVFALGATLYELVTGVRPFTADTPQRVLELIRTRTPMRPSQRSSAVSADLSAIVMKALAKEPADRYQSAAAMALDLRAFEAGRPIQARPPSLPGRLLRWARREPVKAALAVTLCLGALTVSALGGYLLSMSNTIQVGAMTMHEQEVERHLETGFSQLALGLPDDALVALQAARSASPRSIEALAGLALAHLQRGAPAEAIALLSSAPVTSRSPGLQRLLQRARSAAAGGEIAPVTVSAEMADSPLEDFVIGLSDLEQGRRENDPAASRNALAHFRRAVLGSPRSRALYYTELALAAGDAGEADSAREAADALERLWPDAAYTDFHVCYALESIDPARAVRAGEHALARGAASASPRLLSSLDTNLGNARVHAGDRAGAIQAWQRAVELDRRNAHAWCALGLSHASSDPEQAQRYLTTALDLDPDYAKAWRTLGRIRLAARDDAGAIDALQHAVAASPRYVDARYDLARVMSRAGRYAEAVAQLQAATAIEPDHAALWYALGNGLRHTKDFPAAADALQRAAVLEPSNAGPHINYAGVLLELGRCEEAVGELRTALAIQPDDPRIRFNLGLALLSAHRYDQGRVQLQVALESDAETYGPLLREQLLEAGGDPHRIGYDAALCRAALSSSPDASWAHETLLSALEQSDDQQAVRVELRRWAERHPGDAAAWHALAEHCLRQDLDASLQTPVLALHAARRAGDEELVEAAGVAAQRALHRQ